MSHFFSKIRKENGTQYFRQKCMVAENCLKVAESFLTNNFAYNPHLIRTKALIRCLGRQSFYQLCLTSSRNEIFLYIKQSKTIPIRYCFFLNFCFSKVLRWDGIETRLRGLTSCLPVVSTTINSTSSRYLIKVPH